MSQQKAEAFRKMHLDQDMLLIPNAWDAISAKIYEANGFQAVGTTSAGIAASLGYSDNQQVLLESSIQAIQRIVQAVDVPVTADIEAGYGETVTQTCELIKRLISLGVVGINIEDVACYRDERLADPVSQAKKIELIRKVTIEEGVPMVINARTDLFWFGIGEAEQRLQETINRANMYLQAGADVIFIPGCQHLSTIAKLVKAIQAPINILLGPKTPSISALQACGVARVSLGSGPIRTLMGVLQQISEDIVQQHNYERLVQNQISYQRLNRFFG